MSATHVHSAGLLDLRFARTSTGRTYLAGCRQRFPLRVTLPHYLDEADRGMAFLIVQNPAGAVFAGDRLELRLAVEQDARVHLRTQSATRICQMDGGSASQQIALALEPGAYLEYLPELMIPQAGSSFAQRLAANVAPGAALVSAELVAPGRRAYGERFAYESLRLETVLSVGGRELAVDVLDLGPARRSPERAGLLGASDYVASVVIACPGADVERLAADLDERLARVAGATGGVSVLPSDVGVVARVLAPAASGARAAVRTVWEGARLALTGLPLPTRLD
ncbi:MAG: urease accessory protein UreD [Gaiellales bacterium]